MSWGKIRTTGVRNVSISYRSGEYAVLTKSNGQSENEVIKVANELTIIPGTTGNESPLMLALVWYYNFFY